METQGGEDGAFHSTKPPRRWMQSQRPCQPAVCLGTLHQAGPGAEAPERSHPGRSSRGMGLSAAPEQDEAQCSPTRSSDHKPELEWPHPNDSKESALKQGALQPRATPSLPRGRGRGTGPGTGTAHLVPQFLLSRQPFCPRLINSFGAPAMTQALCQTLVLSERAALGRLQTWPHFLYPYIEGITKGRL